ncbi:hypothetical protein Pan2_87 [Pseudanabaena phage Pan2]|nr:hypothetical protein Pan2_87 [Pseudanabaena phage Pan2]
MRINAIRRLARDAAEIGYPLEDALAAVSNATAGGMSYGERITFRTVYMQAIESEENK